jgi:transposase
MLNEPMIPDDLATCQQWLRELLATRGASLSPSSIASELVAAESVELSSSIDCSTLQIDFENLQRDHVSLQAAFATLQQEHVDLQLTVQKLLNQIYGRRRERLDSPGQLYFSFTTGEPLDEETLSVLNDLEQAEDAFVEEVIRRRKQRKRPRSEELPAHLERRTERIEPILPADCPFQLCDCQLMGIDVVENLDYDPPKLWVHRIEYPKYKIPANIQIANDGAARETASSETASSETASSETLANEAPVAEAEAIAVEIPSPIVPSIAPLSENLESVESRTRHSLPNHSHTNESLTLESLVITPVAEPTVIRATEPTTESSTPLDRYSVAVAASHSTPSAATVDAHDGESFSSAASSVMTASPEPKRIVHLPPIMLAGHGILQAPRLANVIDGGRFGFGLVTEVVYHKFVLHVPLYRMQDRFAQQGWSPHRSTLCQMVAHAAEVLRPLAELMKVRLLATDVLGTDDTTVTLLTPGVGAGSRTARFWLYRGRAAAPYNVFDFTDSRERIGPDTFLEPFVGTFTGDCYGGYVNMEHVSGGRIRFAGCWAHARRKLFEARAQQPLLANQILSIIGQLYDVEDRAHVLNDEARRELRQRESVEWMSRLWKVLHSEAATKVLPKSKFGQALSYLRNHWLALQVYLSDGRLPIDNNDTERDLRRVALGRKNWVFLGSEASGDRTSVILTVISSAHRHDLDVWSYLRDVLEQLAIAKLATAETTATAGTVDISSLLPDVWKQSHPEHVRTFRSEEKANRAERQRFTRIVRRRESRAHAEPSRTSSAQSESATGEPSTSA